MELYGVHVRFNPQKAHAALRATSLAAAASLAATAELSLATYCHRCCMRSQVLIGPAWPHAGEDASTRRELQPEF